MKLNIGCGNRTLKGYVNIDENENRAPHANVHMRVPPIPARDNEVSEIFASHFIEHLPILEARYFLRECYRVLRPGGEIGLVVPDIPEVMRRYLAQTGEILDLGPGHVYRLDYLEDINALFWYSGDEKPHHAWAWDYASLTRALESAGFVEIQEIDKKNDSRLTAVVWYDFGIKAWKDR